MFALQKGKEKQASPRRAWSHQAKGRKSSLSLNATFFSALRGRLSFSRDLASPWSPGGEYKVFYSLGGA